MRFAYMDTESLVGSEFDRNLTDDESEVSRGPPTDRTRFQYSRPSFFVFLLSINIVFGCVVFVKLTETTTKTNRLLEGSIEKLSVQLRYMIKDAHDMKVVIHDLEKKLIALLKIEDEMEKMNNQLHKDENLFSQLAKTQAIEAVNDVLRERGLESSECTSTTGKVVWKFDKYNESKQRSMVTYFGPIFHTSQFGYKIQLMYSFERKDASIKLYFGVMRGEYGDLLKWPFFGNITSIIFDQSGQRKDLTHTTKIRQCWAASEPYSNKCWIGWFSDSALQSENYIRNNTLFFGFKVESYEYI